MIIRKTGLLIVIVILFFSVSSAVQISKKVKSPIPDQDSKKWLLAHVDVETTGVIPGYHEMIDIGIVMTDLAGNIIDSLFFRIQAKHPERSDPDALKVNSYNHKKWEQSGALTSGKAVKKIIDFVNKVKGNKTVMIVAHNSHFDTAFIDHLFRSEGRSWEDIFYYYVLDIPSMAWGLGVTHSQIMDHYNIKEEPHTHSGDNGAMLNVRVYKGILKYRKEMNK
ncbi:MAG: exonuclease domain-containing protein [Acidobacteriota bacterium]